MPENDSPAWRKKAAVLGGEHRLHQLLGHVVDAHRPPLLDVLAVVAGDQGRVEVGRVHLPAAELEAGHAPPPEVDHQRHAAPRPLRRREVALVDRQRALAALEASGRRPLPLLERPVPLAPEQPEDLVEVDELPRREDGRPAVEARRLPRRHLVELPGEVPVRPQRPGHQGDEEEGGTPRAPQDAVARAGMSPGGTDPVTGTDEPAVGRVLALAGHRSCGGSPTLGADGCKIGSKGRRVVTRRASQAAPRSMGSAYGGEVTLLQFIYEMPPVRHALPFAKAAH